MQQIYSYVLDTFPVFFDSFIPYPQTHNKYQVLNCVRQMRVSLVTLQFIRFNRPKKVQCGKHCTVMPNTTKIFLRWSILSILFTVHLL